MVVLKRKKEMLYAPLDFEKSITVYGLVDSGAYFSAIAQKNLGRIKQKGLHNFPKSTALTIFKYKKQMAS